MRSSTLLILAGLGIAALLLTKTEKGKKLTDDILDNTDEWKEKLSKLANSTGSQLNDLKKMISKEIEGLSNEARKAIESILEEASAAAKNAKNKSAF
jgi:gas vesicle protein